MKRLTPFYILISLLTYNKADSAYIGPQIMHKSYNETLPSGLKSEEEGILYGFRGGISSILGRFINFDLNTEYFNGKTKYTGTKQSLITKKIVPFKSITENNLFNSEGSIGFPIPFKKISIEPFWGLGFHLWERKMEDYIETYSWVYYQFGGLLSVNLSHFWDLGVEGKGMVPKFANIGINNIYPWKQDISLESHLQYSIKLINKFHWKYFSFYLSGYYQRLEIGPGTNIKKSSFSAPLSTDKLLGGELIAEYNF